MARAEAIKSIPSLGDALSSGELGGEHVDAFGKVLSSLDGPVKEGLTEAASAIVASAAASGSTPDELAAILNAAAQKIAADEKQDHLRALALLALINGRRVPTTQTAAPSNDETGEWDEFADALLGETARLGRPEFVILVDTTNLDDGKPIVDWGIPVTVPWSRIQGFVRRAKLRPVVIHNGAVIDADGELTIDLPHGQIMQTGPPERKAAA